MSARTPVLIVGGGPVGLALAGELGWRGVPCTLIEKTDGSIEQPKMDLVGIRTMEFCRRWGILDWVRDAPYPLDYPQDYIYLTALNGYELGREPFPAAASSPARPRARKSASACRRTCSIRSCGGSRSDPDWRRCVTTANSSRSAKRRTACARRSAIQLAARPKLSKPITWLAPTAAPRPCASSSASA